jgi:hypothetical protein
VANISTLSVESLNINLVYCSIKIPDMTTVEQMAVATMLDVVEVKEFKRNSLKSFRRGKTFREGI